MDRNGRATGTARELIERIMSDPRITRGRNFSSKVYEDEPILRTGSQMASFLPERYRDMKALARRGGYPDPTSEARLFYEQARFMEDFEDDCPYRGTFERYFPTYRMMSDQQLRGYFSWRTDVRRGRVRETSLSFAFVYIYELLNGIGAKGPLEGFAALKSFGEAYRPFAPQIDRYLGTWLRDYVVYHGLEPSLLDDRPESAFDCALTVLHQAAGVYGHEAFDALAELSTYRIKEGRLYREQGDDVRRTVCAVFARLDDYYRRHRKNTLLEHLFGNSATLPYRMFASAVFYEPAPHADTTYVLSPLDLFTCLRGRWSRTCHFGRRDRSPELGRLLKEIDCQLRRALAYPYPLKEGKVPKYVRDIVVREVEAHLAWKRAHTPRVISIDRSKLAGIRLAAASTCEELLIDEERPEPVPAAGRGHGGQGPAEPSRPVASAADLRTGISPTPPDGSVSAMMGTNVRIAAPTPAPCTETGDGVLSPAEAAYVLCLLDGGDRAAAIGRAGPTEDMLVDRINEKLFDVLGDTAIAFENGEACVVEDYRDDVRGFVQP